VALMALGVLPVIALQACGGEDVPSPGATATAAAEATMTVLASWDEVTFRYEVMKRLDSLAQAGNLPAYQTAIAQEPARQAAWDAYFQAATAAALALTPTAAPAADNGDEEEVPPDTLPTVVDLNSASAEEIAALPGAQPGQTLGMEVAGKILALRAQPGALPIQYLDDLNTVPEIDEIVIEAIAACDCTVQKRKPA
jgi:DNA uptake protein ComE-like DNA-binding protein